MTLLYLCVHPDIPKLLIERDVAKIAVKLLFSTDHIIRELSIILLKVNNNNYYNSYFETSIIVLLLLTVTVNNNNNKIIKIIIVIIFLFIMIVFIIKALILYDSDAVTGLIPKEKTYLLQRDMYNPQLYGGEYGGMIQVLLLFLLLLQ